MLVTVNRWAATVPPGMVPKSWTRTAGGLSFWKNLLAHGTAWAVGCWAKAEAGATARARIKVKRTNGAIPRPPVPDEGTRFPIGRPAVHTEVGKLGEPGNSRETARPPGGVCAGYLD